MSPRVSQFGEGPPLWTENALSQGTQKCRDPGCGRRDGQGSGGLFGEGSILAVTWGGKVATILPQCPTDSGPGLGGPRRRPGATGHCSALS